MRIMSAALCFHFLSISILSLIITVPSSSGCNRFCRYGTDPQEVDYPFGFSDDCQIPLNCTEGGGIQIGAFVAYPNRDRIMVSIPSKCSRSIQELKPLFGNNYAPSLLNVILVQNCTSPPPNCSSILTNLIEPHLKKGCDRPHCFTKEKNDSNYMSFADLEQTSCTQVFSSFSSESSGLAFEIFWLDWWLEGECNCSSNAVCKNITSPVNGKRSFQCSCPNGLYGDGFTAAGDGCNQYGSYGPAYSPSLNSPPADSPSADSGLEEPIYNSGGFSILQMAPPPN